MTGARDTTAGMAGMRQSGAGWLVLVGLFVTVSLAAILILGERVFVKAAEHRHAANENVEWTASQVETELLRLLLAIRRVEGGEAALSELRTRFDIFYSRVDVLGEGDNFAPLRADPQAAASLDRLEAFLARTVPLIDGPDPALRALLPAIGRDVRGLHDAARDLVLRAVEFYAVRADTEREEFARLLSFTANATLGILVALIIYSLVLLWQFRLTRLREAALRRSGERLAATVTSALDAVVAIDAAGRIFEFNPAAERVFGYSRDQALGQPMSELIVPPALREAHLKGFERHLTTGETAVVGHGRQELTALNAAGEVFPVELAVGRSVGEDGPVFIAYLRDITERNRVRRELTVARDRAEAADRAKSEFLAVMSHEMRTPLNGILAALDLLRASTLAPPQAEHVELASRSGEILLRHIDDVLEITRIEAGKIELQEHPFDLARLIRETCHLVREEALRRDNQVSCSLSGDLPPAVLGDEHRIRQVLLNIMANAVKFTAEGTIEVTVGPAGGTADRPSIEFSVRDTGRGIAEGDIERLFDDFVLLDPSYSREVGGSGLGLAICRRIVRAMGGEIGVESRLGEGSRFWFRLSLPAADDVAVDTIPEAIDAQSATGRRVLLVEDNEINRAVAEAMLTGAGYSVVTAEDGMGAVERAGHAAFDLILMDISMPRMDGIEATRRIREGTGKSRDKPIIGITAHAQPSEIERFIRAGMQGCLTKPLRREAFLKTLGDLSGMHGHETPPAAEISEDGLDREEMQRLSDELPPDFLQEVLERFGEELSDRHAELQAASRAGNVAEIGRIAHRLHGGAASVGASALARLMAEIEVAAKDGALETCERLLSRYDDLSIAVRRDIAQAKVVLPAGP